MRSPSRPARRRFDPPSLVALASFALAWASVCVLRGIPTWAWLLYAGASALCFALYVADKGAARAGRGRIPESMLIAVGAVGGWPGAILAQQLVRHKTAKRTFSVRFWLSVIANVAVFLWLTTHRPGSPP